MDWLLVKKAWEVVRKPEVCGRPWYVQLEVTTHCNLACYMCVRNEVIKHPRHLSLADFQLLFDQIQPRRLTLSGAGEPLLNPDIVAMIAHAGRHGAATMVPTNGTLLGKAELARGLVEAGLTTLKISIDAATAQTYQAIRRQDCFDRVLDGIRQLEEVKRRCNRRTPELRFDVVILKENWAQIPDIVDLARQRGIGTIFFRPLQVTGIGKDREAIGRDVDFEGLYRAVREGLRARNGWASARISRRSPATSPRIDPSTSAGMRPWIVTCACCPGCSASSRSRASCLRAVRRTRTRASPPATCLRRGSRRCGTVRGCRRFVASSAGARIRWPSAAIASRAVCRSCSR